MEAQLLAERPSDEQIFRELTLENLEAEAEAIDNELLMALEDNGEFEREITPAPDNYEDPSVQIPLTLIRNVTEAAKGVVVEKTSISYERYVSSHSICLCSFV